MDSFANAGTADASNEYVSLLLRKKTSTLPGHLSPDIRIPFAPYHLIPEELKINYGDTTGSGQQNYASHADFASKKYTENKFQNQVPYDTYLNEGYLHRPRQLLAGAFSYTLPEVRKEYNYLTTAPNAAKDLGINLEYELNEANRTYYKEIVSGQKIVGDHFPYSQAYAGWQFGQFAGQLGDGRVVNLFEIESAAANSNGNRKYEIQLKGSGKTPYSRFADGKAVLRSSIREFIISEYLNAIGIPSTRSLAITSLPKTYAQRHGTETCATVARFAESWVRLGSFDLFRYRGDRKGLRQLADYCIDQVYKGEENLGSFNALKESATKYDKLYKEIVVRNARTTAMTQIYGFLNGVLNTDNTSVLGLCIDFGPFAIMDKFDPDYTPNSEDHEKRYGYDNVPSSIWWNLTRLGENLGELIGAGPELLKDEKFVEKGEFDKEEWEEKIINRANLVIDAASKEYEDEFLKTYIEVFGKRLGFATVEEKDNEELISPMLQMLWNTQINYNRFFVILNSLKFFDNDGASSNINKDPTELVDYHKFAQQFIPKGFENSKSLTHEEIADQIVDFLRKYHQRLIKENSLSDDERLARSKHFNPVFVPSNWIIEDVVDTLKDNRCSDISKLEKLVKMVSQPFDTETWGEELKDVEHRWLDLDDEYDPEKYMLQCSCAS